LRFKGALKTRPEVLCNRILIPDKSHALADGGIHGAARGLRLDTRMADGTDEF
jgi:hypothetical protein